ncbi:hypothetical protein G6F16_001715 [Rhizopus arrhizus]|nr:hypothetical protein G6F21_002291 [Rhizopus arrhizus]KAG0819722.1 hypothetical protein G6F20_000508 [Rhizopus arrhizus]KAG0837981.1 hypothetical protein G6F19_003406 [Rhizopus arrhizus]KAG0846061.1 hypothetical protein G6F18_000365 [Rhizopus arrhizus]KAG0860773.1 hypothetical protein G6F17_000684 [Rhizopus arrhizus]
MDSDEVFAKYLQEQEDLLSKDYELAKRLQQEQSICIEQEPHPDIYRLFSTYNQQYFDGKLDRVELCWSTKMTRCAGTCTYMLGGHCVIRLSEPLLKFRSKKDLLETLLHEMIHAYLFVTQRNGNHDGHGPEFLYEAKRINELTNLNISVYHNFMDEVDYYLTHVWQCNGVCQDIPPYYGIVKRSMNRPPQPADSWYAEHQLTCGGTFIKLSEPTHTNKKRKKPQSNTLDHYFKRTKN